MKPFLPLGAVLALLTSLALATAPADEAQQPPAHGFLAVGEPLRDLALDLPDSVADALRQRRWKAALTGLRAMDAASLPGHRKGDWAFLVAWCSIHGESPEAAADVLTWMDESTTVPEAYAALVRAEVLLATGEPLQAIEWLDRVPAGAVLSPRAALVAADALRELGRTKEAWERAAALVERPDPAEGSAQALLALAEHHGIGSDEAYPLLRRLWASYPHTDEGAAAERHLQAYAGQKPSWQETARRAEQWMYAGALERAVTETAGTVAHASEPNVDGCRLRYTRGRSEYKRNRITAAASELAGIGEQCVEVSEDFGPRGLYLLGTAHYRRKQYLASAEAYRQLTELYPDHSMADDAYTRGGISLLEAGDEDGARERWEAALDRHPEGDTVPEAALRLAMARYDAGDPSDAIAIAERLGALPRTGDATHVEAGLYWAARWRYYPHADDPRKPNADAAARAEAIERWRALCRELPHSFYAILAYSRLVELAPEVARELAQRPPEHDDGRQVLPWQVRVSMASDPHVRDGVALVRLGLVQEGMAEWARADQGGWLPDEKAWTTELRIAAGDWLLAHDDLRDWLHTHPLGTLGEREPQIVRLAYPDRYWDEVQGSMSRYRYEPRLFHGLVREESNFNREIVSFAGAMGLSQLMWPTAQQTAGWLGISITRADLNHPETNLKIGARYLEAMHKQLADSPYLALAAYNGGAGNVNKWLTAHGNPPTDEYVERIPFRETRGYVKRVMATWQTMRFRFDDGAAFPDLSAYNHHAKP